VFFFFLITKQFIAPETFDYFSYSYWWAGGY